jgi:hypothetical protein
MTYESLFYVLVFWMQVYGFADCLSNNGADRFCGWVTLTFATALMLFADRLVG